MLILTRRVGEKILIGDDIVIAFVKSKGKNIQIGVSAPKEVSVYREEILHQLQTKNLIKNKDEVEVQNEI